MTVASLAALLRDHVGHRTTIVEPAGTGLAVKCIDCAGRLTDLSGALNLRPGSTQPTPARTTDGPLRIGASDACPQHVGERADTCGPCRSEQLEASTPIVSLPVGVPMPDDFRDRVAEATRATDR
jgi:hypothetical protein